MAQWSLIEYIKRNLINGYKDGTWTESKVSQLAVSYLENGYLTTEDIELIDNDIQSIKTEREAAKQALIEDAITEEIQ